MQITRYQLRTWGACYDDELIAALVPPDGLTPLQVCDLASVSAVDRLWVLLHEDIISARELRLLACRWAERACDAVGVGPGASRDAIAVARRYAVGDATVEELDAAWNAAWDAADAASASARNAAWVAAWVASPVTRHAAWAATGDAQLADVRRVLLAGGEP